MMKKILYIFGFLMFFTALFSPLVSRSVLGAENDPCKTAADQPFSGDQKCVPFSTARLFSKMVEKVGKGKLNPNKNISEVFGTEDPNKAGQNMYLKIYDQTVNQPEQKAFKNTAGKFGVTEAEISQVLSGNFSPILARKPTLLQDDAVSKMLEIQREYQEEKDILAFQADIESRVVSSEFFANGDINDSGFDLINDLNLIETILFKKADPIDVGASFVPKGAEGGGASGGNAGSGGQEAGGQNGQSGGGEPKPGEDGQKPQGGTQEQGQGTQQAGGTQGTQQAGGAHGTQQAGQNQTPPSTGGNQNTLRAAISPAENPNLCFTSNVLNKALKNFEEAKKKNPNYKDNSGSKSGSSSTSGASGSQNTGSGYQNAGGKDGTKDTGASPSGEDTKAKKPGDTTKPEPFTYQAPPQKAVEPAPADKWLKELPCKDFFCITVKFVKKKAAAYQNTDNCIACHVEKINEKLKETVTHSLTPAKAPGNLGETGSCKKASANSLTAVGLNFYAIAQPVQTPKNDDIIYGVGIQEEWKNFVNIYKPFPVEERKATEAAKPNEAPIPSTEADRATKMALVLVAPDTTLQEVQVAIQSEIDGNISKREEAIAVAEASLQSDTDAGFYQALRREMEQMNAYFMLYQKILTSLHEKVEGMSGKQACTDLKQKKECPK